MAIASLKEHHILLHTSTCFSDKIRLFCRWSQVGEDMSWWRGRGYVKEPSGSSLGIQLQLSLSIQNSENSYASASLAPLGKTKCIIKTEAKGPLSISLTTVINNFINLIHLPVASEKESSDNWPTDSRSWYPVASAVWTNVCVQKIALSKKTTVRSNRWFQIWLAYQELFDFLIKSNVCRYTFLNFCLLSECELYLQLITNSMYCWTKTATIDYNR